MQVMDEDIRSMSREQLVAEVLTLRYGIRERAVSPWAAERAVK